MNIPQMLAQGVNFYNTGKLAEAEAAYRQVLAVQPNHPEALHLLGVIAKDVGRNDMAVDLISRAISIAPNNAHFHCNLALALANLGQREPSMSALQRALQLDPNSPQIYNNLGNAFFADASRVEDAIACYRQALRLKPDFVDARNNLGNCLLMQRKIDEAIEQYKLALRPDFPQAHYNLAFAYLSANQNMAAIEQYRRSINLEPDYPEAWNNLGNAYKETGQAAEAAAAYRRSVSMGRKLPGANSNLLYALHLLPDIKPQEMFEEHLAWNQRYGAEFAGSIAPHTNIRQANRKIRIGYVSPDFREHSVAHFFAPLIEHFDRSHFEVFCYADLLKVDDYSKRFESLATCFRNVTGQSDQAIADQIRRDQIDILVDLAGHTSGHRLLVFARKPAPIQATYLGYPDTTGLATMDYRLTDAISDPPGQTDRFHTEKLARLPGTFLCFTPPRDLPPPGPPPCLTNGHITFGSCTGLVKINEMVLGWWSEILRAVPKSRLLLKSRVLGDPATKKRVERVLRDVKMPLERVDMLGWTLVRENHLLVYDHIDICLDTYPYHGTTTTCEALWAGVPVVTMAGDTHGRRVGVSLLTAAGLERLIATTPKQYMELAIAEANDRDDLAELRKTLRTKLASSTLMDGVQFTHEVESFYRQWWQQWCATTPPLASDTAESHYQLGDQLFEQGRLAEAVEEFRKSLSLQARSPVCLLRMADALQNLGRFEEAIAAYQQAIAIIPPSSEILSNIGHCLSNLGRLDQALGVFRQAIQLRPDNFMALHNAGNALFHQGRMSDALLFYQETLRLKPDYVEAYNNLGNALWALGRMDESTDAYRKALSIRPDHVNSLSNLAGNLKDMSQIGEALSIYQNIRRLAPNHAGLHSNYIYLLNFSPESTPGKILEEQTRWDEQHGRHMATPSHRNSRDARRKLRIGYVSADFKEHVVAWNLAPILEHHDQKQFEIFCYSNSLHSNAMTDRLKSASNQWRSISGISNQRAAEMVRADEIDILMDLSLHSAGNRLGVFTHKPAPIQITYLGYCGATGLSAMDYRISDPLIDNANTEKDYREKTLYLPHCYWSYTPGGAAPEPRQTGNKSIVFGCLNNFAKASMPARKAWLEILNSVAGSRLILCTQPGKYLEDVLRLFGGCIEFVPRQKFEDYIQTYQRIDIALDPFPYNGGITTCDALYMGVPVVTLAGTLSIGRAGQSILENIGLGDLVADTLENYIEMAVALAADRARLQDLRQSLRPRILKSSLMNPSGFTRDFETLLRGAWARWCAGDR